MRRAAARELSSQRALGERGSSPCRGRRMKGGEAGEEIAGRGRAGCCLSGSVAGDEQIALFRHFPQGCAGGGMEAMERPVVLAGGKRPFFFEGGENAPGALGRDPCRFVSFRSRVLAVVSRSVRRIRTAQRHKFVQPLVVKALHGQSEQNLTRGLNANRSSRLQFAQGAADAEVFRVAKQDRIRWR